MEEILLVEDDKQLSNITRRMLESRDYSVTTAYTVASAKEKFVQKPFDLVLLDLMLPDGEGAEVCEFIREQSICPIIFMSCMSDLSTKLQALSRGGDDYVTKPVNYEELLARIEANIRRFKQYVPKQTPKTSVEELRFPGLLIKKKRREVWLTDAFRREKAKLDLSPIEYGLLLVFAEHSDELVSYQELFRQVWHVEDDSDVRTVMVHVSNLRKKMGAAGNLIHTVRGCGYILKIE